MKRDNIYRKRLDKHMDELKWLYMEIYNSQDMFDGLLKGMEGEALLNTVALETHGNPLSLYVTLEGLDPEAMYRDEDTGTEYPGAGLMSAGIPIPSRTGEYQAFQVHLRRI